MTRHRARKRFGQHFLTDPGVIDAIVDAVHPAKDDTIVEIGPGQGAITVALARRSGHLHAVELDRDLVAALREKYAGESNITLHEADALEFDFSSLGARLRIVRSSIGCQNSKIFQNGLLCLKSLKNCNLFIHLKKRDCVFILLG